LAKRAVAISSPQKRRSRIIFDPPIALCPKTYSAWVTQVFDSKRVECLIQIAHKHMFLGQRDFEFQIATQSSGWRAGSKNKIQLIRTKPQMKLD
jgi:hypothetical protein